MAVKKTPSISVRINRMVDSENTSIRAEASANIGGAFAIHGIRVIDSEKGPFVQMPQRSYQKDGETVYKDLFHPITAEARTELYGKVMEAYEQRLAEQQVEEQAEDEALDEQSEDETPAFGMSM